MEAKYLENWLRDAHAMEKQAEEMLKAQAKRIDHYPALRARIDQHLHETERQSEKLERVMSELGIDTSAMKDMGGKLTAFGQSLGGMMAGDEVVKGGIASYAFECFEIANYKALIAAAELANQPNVARVCREILEEEEAMADWLEQHLDDTTRTFLTRADDRDVQAKK
ncbi:ferritin-like domain-containing protein [Halomonas sp. DWK9]|uniref:ferritin-like domain-containing protein n=1 Tax=Halomonas sp. DWK9 TaxID=3060155 RepID=UPI00287F645E|nr:ferritin-like domain-containing protein [Halomonas sp. DWK9]